MAMLDNDELYRCRNYYLCRSKLAGLDRAVYSDDVQKNMG